MIFFKNEVLSGRLPLWNPYLYAGLPHLADPTNNVLSLINIFYLLFSPVLAINVITATAFFLAGLGMYLFAKSLELKKIAAYFAGISFMFCGSCLTLINDINSFLTVSFIPWIFFGFIKWLKTKNFSWFFLTVLLAAFQFFSGHPQYVYWTWVFLALFALFCLPKITFREKFKKMALLAMAFVALSAIQLLPFMELMKNAFRPSSLDFAKNGRFGFLELPRLFLVNFYGQLKNGTSWGPGSLLETGLGGISGYIGFLSLLFLGLGMIFMAKKIVFLFSLALLALAMSFGPQLPVYNFLRILPFFKLFRSLSRVLVFWSFFGILGAGIVFNQALKQKGAKKGLKLGILFLALALLSLWQKSWLIKNSLKLFVFLYEFLKKKPLNTFVYNKEKLKIIINLWHENLTVVLFGLMSFSFFLFKKSLWPLIFVFLVLESFWFGKNEFLIIPKGFMNPNPGIISFLQKEAGYQRIISTGEVIPFTGLQSYWSHLRSRPPFSGNEIGANEFKDFPRFKKEVDMLPVNLTENYKLFNPSGYTAVVLKNYARFWDSEAVNSITIPKIDDERLDLLGTRFLITGYPDDFIKESHENLQLAGQFEETKIYKNKNALPRAFLIDENEKIIGKTKIVSFLPSKVEIETEATRTAKLVLTDNFYPGWRAKIDGEKTEIVPFKKTFRSVLVPEGKHKVVFYYQPKSFILGSIISTGALSILGVILWRKRKKLA